MYCLSAGRGLLFTLGCGGGTTETIRDDTGATGMSGTGGTLGDVGVDIAGVPATVTGRREFRRWL